MLFLRLTPLALQTRSEFNVLQISSALCCETYALDTYEDECVDKTRKRGEKDCL